MDDILSSFTASMRLDAAHQSHAPHIPSSDASKSSAGFFLNNIRERELWKEGSLFCMKLNQDSRINVIPFIGIHPWDTAEADDETLAELEETAAESGAFIGEIGLDRLRGAEREKQVFIFRKALDIAIRLDKPFTIHCVREWGLLIRILEESRERIKTPFIVHAWGGSAETMKKIISLGGFISFGTLSSGEFSEKASGCIRNIGMDRMLLETDFTCTPENLPAAAGEEGALYAEQLFSVYSRAADLLGIDITELSGAIEENGKVFKACAADRQ